MPMPAERLAGISALSVPVADPAPVGAVPPGLLRELGPSTRRKRSLAVVP